MIQHCDHSFSDLALSESGFFTGTVLAATGEMGGYSSYTFVLERLLPPSVGSTALVPGQPIEAMTDPRGDVDLYYFAGQSDQAILLQTVWYDGAMKPCLQLIRPDSSRLDACQNEFVNQLNINLSQNGTYTVLVDNYYNGTGSYGLQLEGLMPPSPDAQLLDYSSSISETIEIAGELDLYRFEGEVGDQIMLNVTSGTGSLQPCLQLIKPDTSRQTACEPEPSNQLAMILDQSGTYAVVVDGHLGETGTYTLQMACAQENCQRTQPVPSFLYLPLVKTGP
jgi:hypothetical protein